VAGLEDGVVALRRFTEADVPAVVAACQDPEVPRWTHVPSPYTEADARSFVAGSEGVHAFAVVDPGTDELLGCVAYALLGEGRGHFGYWTCREARGRGVASRALRLAVAHAIAEHGLTRLQLVVEPANEASIRVAENAGFRCERLLRGYVELKEERRDVYMYALPVGDVR
jgi:RimJ/RimL family protein N-acetyltransferase